MSAKPIFTCEDVRQYYYCPRIIYFRYVLRVKVPTTYKMDYGSKIHEKVRLKGNVRRNVYLFSEDLGLSCILDAIEYVDDSTIDIIEIKSGRVFRNIIDSHKAQLAAGAMLIERVLGYRVRKIKVFYVEKEKFATVEVRKFHRDLVLRALDHMREIVTKEIIPNANWSAKCSECEYKKVCLEV